MTEFDTLTIINVICPTISLIASTLICFEYMFHVYMGKKNTLMHLVFSLSMSGIGTGLGDILMLWPRNKPVCLTGALFLTMFDWTSCAWCGVIAHYAYIVICQSRTRLGEDEKKKRILWYHTIVWGSGLILVALPLVGGFEEDGHPLLYGFDGKWCWLAEGAPGYWTFIIFYVPLWILEGCIVRMMHKARAELRDIIELSSVLRTSHVTEDRQQLSDLDGKVKVYRALAGYPLVLIIVWFVGTIRRVWLLFFPSANPIWFAALHLSTASMQGFFNCIVFYNKDHIIPMNEKKKYIYTSVRNTKIGQYTSQFLSKSASRASSWEEQEMPSRMPENRLEYLSELEQKPEKIVVDASQS